MKNWHILLLGILLGLLSAGIILLVTLPPRGKPVTIQTPVLESDLSPSQSSLTPTLIMIHIAGEVHNPGIWSLPIGSRISDGILAAGGMTDLADPNRINLAAQLIDGTKIYVPALGEAIPVDITDVNQTQGYNSPVNINLASLDELCTLPGIGPTKAQSIINYRTTSGLFLEIGEILNVPGIGESIFNQIKDMITVK